MGVSFSALVIGVLGSYAFSVYFGLFLSLLASIGYLANKIYIAKIAEKTKELSEASRVHLATVEALATAIDARDQVGIGHVRRTQIYAVGIGKTLCLSDDELNALNTGALLHDIGKLAVPDHILNKPGRLTPAEMEKVKIHSSVGASILEKVHFSYPVVPTVKYHHERWDGDGYPVGLQGEDIPLTARILGLADAYDTLRGARPYRAPVSRDEARRFILSGSGTQFDPKIVDVFLRNLRKFEAEIEAQEISYANGEGGSDVHISTTDKNSDQSYVEQIKRANREVFTLYELARVFSASLNLEETLSLFVNKISEIVPFDTCVVYLADETGEQAKTAYAKGKNSSLLKNKLVKAGEGATGYVLKRRQPIHKIEPGLDFSFHQLELIEEYSVMASLPLFVEEKLLGAVSLYSCEMEDYEEEHMRLLETVSRIASDAISVSLQHAESESRALTDPMTGLPNARSLQAQFEKEAGRANRNGSSFQLLMLDLDGFKAVNDTFGHKVGDQMLKEVSKVMRAELRDYDFLARYAGDEFVVIAPETTDEDIQELCRRMEKAVCDFLLPTASGRRASVGVSLGAACYPSEGETLDQIIIAADKAMYAVKGARKEKINATKEFQLSGEFGVAVIPEEPIENTLIVELDESHVISTAIN
jgi:diguanylate cyclase (GGDEF)-like protein/putative nucleotidyltransferase with HDIG domain